MRRTSVRIAVDGRVRARSDPARALASIREPYQAPEPPGGARTRPRALRPASRGPRHAPRREGRPGRDRGRLAGRGPRDASLVARARRARAVRPPVRPRVAARDPDRSRARCAPSPRSSTPSRPARLWHWRTRTEALRAADALELPASWDSFEQLVAVAAMRGYERGPPALPAPRRLPGLRHRLPRPLAPRSAPRSSRSPTSATGRSSGSCGAGRDWAETPTDT